VTAPTPDQSSAANAATTPAASNTGGATTAAAGSNGAPGQATTSTPATTATSSAPASTAPAASATPQQTIANFLQNVLARLGAAANGSGGTVSASWGIQLLAVVLPVYAQSQAATGPQATTGQASSASQTPSGTGNGAPAVTQVAIPAPVQAAQLAAATLVQLVN
jgi:hypothetical protein